MSYENILKALNSNSNSLSSQQRADNYSAFSKMMDSGVYIPDLLKKIDDLEAKVKELEASPKKSQVDVDLFTVMEASVKDDPEVIAMRDKVRDERMRVVSEICMKDDTYRKTYEDYRRAVNAKFIRFRAEAHPELRQEQEGQGTPAESVPHE